MPYSVRGAFEEFRKYSVDLDAEDVKTARSSRDFLIDQLIDISKKTAGFPKLTGAYHHFGSFARRTKIRPLDDIDLMPILDASGTTECGTSTPYRFWLRMDDKTKPLASFLDDYGYVNSTRILFKIRDSLGSVSQYSKAEIKKNQEAVTLNLKSYPWTFDIVPAVAIKGYGAVTAHYLIPDGSGEWMRTDPRKDSANMTAANLQHGGNLLPVMRLLKYWNNRTGNKPRLPSYYFETLVINTFRYAQTIASFQEGVKYYFEYGGTRLFDSCPDPKDLGPNLDANVTWEAKQKVATAMSGAATFARNAVYYEGQDDAKNAIAWWQRVFGPSFPGYGT